MPNRVQGCAFHLPRQMPGFKAPNFEARDSPRDNAFYLPHVIHTLAYRLLFQRELKKTAGVGRELNFKLECISTTEKDAFKEQRN